VGEAANEDEAPGGEGARARPAHEVLVWSDYI
jgi:hypothetical protein